MAVAYGAAGTPVTRTNNSATLTVTLPAGFSANDLLFVLWIQDGNNSAFPSAPTGWTRLGFTGTGADTTRVGLFYKIAAGGDSDPVFTCSTAAYPNGDAYVKACAFYATGNDTATPFDTWSITAGTTGNVTTESCPSVTPTQDGCGLILVRGGTIPSGTTNRTFTSDVTSASPAGVEIWDSAQAQQIDGAAYFRDGSFGTSAQSFSITSSANISNNVSGSILIAPAATGTNHALATDTTSTTTTAADLFNAKVLATDSTATTSTSADLALSTLILASDATATTSTTADLTVLDTTPDLAADVTATTTTAADLGVAGIELLDAAITATSSDSVTLVLSNLALQGEV